MLWFSFFIMKKLRFGCWIYSSHRTTNFASIYCQIISNIHQTNRQSSSNFPCTSQHSLSQSSNTINSCQTSINSLFKSTSLTNTRKSVSNTIFSFFDYISYSLRSLHKCMQDISNCQSQSSYRSSCSSSYRITKKISSICFWRTTFSSFQSFFVYCPRCFKNFSSFSHLIKMKI